MKVKRARLVRCHWCGASTLVVNPAKWQANGWGLVRDTEPLPYCPACAIKLNRTNDEDESD